MPKQLYIAILFVFISVINYAQIPNTGFEAWTNTGAYETPDNWDNLNQMTNNSGIYTCIKGTPGYSGTSYLFLSSKAIAGKGIVPGIAVCGK
jgi:Trk-type K+ transport system membrane component